jgi:integrase
MSSSVHRRSSANRVQPRVRNRVADHVPPPPPPPPAISVVRPVPSAPAAASQVKWNLAHMQLHSSNLLRSSSVGNTTADVYDSAVASFEEFCVVNQLIGQLPSDIDSHLTVYMESLYQNSIPGGKQHAANALFGLIRQHPQLKQYLPRARQAHKGFSRLVRSQSHPPLTWYSCVAIASVMAKSGHLHRAVAVMLMFHCMLRISEAMSLRVSDIALPHEGRFGACSSTLLSSLRIAKSKTGENQSVSIDDIQLQSLLMHIMHGRRPDELLFGCSTDAFSKSFANACTALGMNGMGFVPHSCRHGGATLSHVNGVSIEQIMLRGRWKSNESCRTYLQTHRSVLLTVRLPPSVHEIGRMVATHLSNNILQLHAIAVSSTSTLSQ